MTAALIDELKGNDAVLNLVVSPARSHHPTGDTFHFDVLNGAANSVIEVLRLRGIVEEGSIVIETVDALLSSTAEVAEREQPRFEGFTPIWALVDARIRAEGIYPPSWFVLLIIAGVIGSIGILTNSQILIVAAMVVGPEYGAITAIARAGTRRDGRTARRGLTALGLGFTGAVIASLTLALIIRAAGVTPRAFEIGVRPVSDLIKFPQCVLGDRGGARWHCRSDLAHRVASQHAYRRVHLGDDHSCRGRYWALGRLRIVARGLGLVLPALAQRVHSDRGGHDHARRTETHLESGGANQRRDQRSA